MVNPILCLLAALGLAVLAPAASAQSAAEINRQIDICGNLGGGHSYGAIYDGCSAVIRAAVPDPEIMAHAFHNRGVAGYRQGYYAIALADLSSASRLRPSDPSYHFSKGLAHHALRELDQASESFAEAVRLNPQFDGGYLGRGMISYERGNFALARTDVERAISLNPARAQSYCMLASIENAAGNSQRAAELRSEARRRGPNSGC